MKKYILVILVCIATSTVAQAPKQDKKLTLVLNVADVEVVMAALQKLPYEQSAGIIQSIYAQAQKQLSDTTKKK